MTWENPSTLIEGVPKSEHKLHRMGKELEQEQNYSAEIKVEEFENIVEQKWAAKDPIGFCKTCSS